MKISSTVVALILASLILPSALAQESNGKSDPVLTDLQTQLVKALRELNVTAIMEIPDAYAGKSLVLRYKTRPYKVYPQSKAGRLGRELVEREGPDDEGILLRAHVQKAGEVNQAAVPQTIREPYWSTYLNVYPVAGTGKQIYMALSYRGWTDKKLIERITKVAEQMGAGHE